jgi:hypothetical protein
MKDLIDDTQIELADVEQNYSLKFYTAYLSGTRSMIQVFNRLLYKE